MARLAEGSDRLFLQSCVSDSFTLFMAQCYLSSVRTENKTAKLLFFVCNLNPKSKSITLALTLTLNITPILTVNLTLVSSPNSITLSPTVALILIYGRKIRPLNRYFLFVGTEDNIHIVHDAVLSQNCSIPNSWFSLHKIGESTILGCCSGVKYYRITISS